MYHQRSGSLKSILLGLGFFASSALLPSAVFANPTPPAGSCGTQSPSDRPADCPKRLGDYQREGYQMKHATRNITIWTKTKADLERRINDLQTSQTSKTHQLQMQSMELTAKIQTQQALCPIFKANLGPCRTLKLQQKTLASYQRKLAMLNKSFERKNSRLQSKLSKATSNLQTYQGRKTEAESKREGLRGGLQTQCCYNLNGY